MKKLFIAPLLLMLMLSSVACAQSVPAPTGQEPAVRNISAEEAKRMMDETEGYVLLDVRTAEEFAAGHIDGALLIPYDALPARAEAKLDDKQATILLYCRSGRRSAIAADTLKALGYLNIYDFGGINDWPYETVQGE